MTNNQENKLTMYEAVQTLLDANGDKTTGNPAFAGAVGRFRSTVEGIKGKSSELEAAGVGRASAKVQAEDQLVSTLMPIASALFVHAGVSSNAELKQKADVSESALRRIRDTDLVAKASALLRTANQYASALGDFGVTPAMLTECQTKLDAFNASIGQRESGAAERVAARTNLLELFDVADKTLNEELDRLMELVRGSQTQFYNEYFAARVIKDLGVRHRPAQATAPQPGT
jgi:hypothetical protein